MRQLVRRLWRPTHSLFWLCVIFNALGVGCAWVARLPGIGLIGLWVMVLLALGNMVAGLVIARQLLRQPAVGAGKGVDAQS